MRGSRISIPFMTVPSRQHPSTRYQSLLQMYRQMHVEGEKFLGKLPEDTFPGGSLGPHVGHIQGLIRRTGAQNVLDYGCGKGKLYDVRDLPLPEGGVVESIQDFWDVDFVHCYDPAYTPFSTLPSGTFHGVICTDVLEHCPEEDLPWILGEIFGFAERFVFLTIASYPAKKRLPSGENAHITIRPPEWWSDVVGAIAARKPELLWDAVVETYETQPDGKKKQGGLRIGNVRPQA